MRSFLAALLLALLICVPANADARSRQSSRDAAILRELRGELREVKRDLAATLAATRELASIAKLFWTDVAVTNVPMPPPRNPILEANNPIPDMSSIATKALAVHVFPANAVQRGQFNDRRRTHRHAGIDLGGAWGSPIVASFAGLVIPSPGRDRGYGPHVVMIKGDDGIVYRYAHLASKSVKIGQHVAAGQTIGTMGKVGPRGFPHLHFEMIPVAEYRRRPYGVHSLDPNNYLGGGRGHRMVAGVPMVGQAATRYAVAR